MDQLAAMRTFVRVVQTGSFSSAGREQSSSQATISKRVAGLETLLGVKLLVRSSRELSLTETGRVYYEKCIAILMELDEADADARSQTALPKGILRIAAPIAIARLVIAPLIKTFIDQYPEIKVEIVAADAHVDLIADGIDVAVRAKKLEDSSLVARHLFDNPMLLVASPDYLQVHGRPAKPEDLAHHNCIVYSLLSSVNIWHFSSKGENITVQVKGSFQSNNGDTNLEAALAGVGITQLPVWMVHEYLNNGRLTQILTDYTAASIPLNAIYPQNRYVPLKVRCFVDFLKKNLAENPMLM
ncbi:LysR family transcriptional regulator [Psychromonas aquimarina]|uniref:LysR family transcriptional regulator n=1 Tax=Psychromonas aquimarina TaxID=444919 RepID=UPI00040EA663|nr:LysR family transcriptional regulator [Psychromonas aquimarina]